MISDIIAAHIEANTPSLTLGDNLFSEQSVGDKTVTVITKNLTPWPGMEENFRQAVIEVEVKGYRMAEAHVLCENLQKLIIGMATVVISDTPENYAIRTVQPKQLPCYKHNGTVTFSFRISYVVEGE